MRARKIEAITFYRFAFVVGVVAAYWALNRTYSTARETCTENLPKKIEAAGN